MFPVKSENIGDNYDPKIIHAVIQKVVKEAKRKNMTDVLKNEFERIEQENAQL